jgi:hypothetical protein
MQMTEKELRILVREEVRKFKKNQAALKESKQALGKKVLTKDQLKESLYSFFSTPMNSPIKEGQYGSVSANIKKSAWYTELAEDAKILVNDYAGANILVLGPTDVTSILRVVKLDEDNKVIPWEMTTGGLALPREHIVMDTESARAKPKEAVKKKEGQV